MIDDAHYAAPAEPEFDLLSLGLGPISFAPGIYFGLDENDYHNNFALSSSGIKDFRISPYLWWSKSLLNPRREQVLAEERGSDAKSLGQAFDARIICGKEYFASKYAAVLTHAEYPKSLRTVDDMKGWLEERGLPKSAKTKAELIDRILAAEPTAQIWDAILDGYLKENEGKTLLDPEWMDKIEIAAALIERHPELSQALVGGAPQVSVFWTCENTGVPCRARFDYLKQKLIVDLKTIEPRGDLPLETAIGREIGFRKYYLQSSFYLEAAQQIPRLIKAGKVFGDAPAGLVDKLARHHGKQFGWIFQTKSVAPQAFGYILPTSSYLHGVGDAVCDDVKHRFAECLKHYGALPWLDATGFRALDDNNVPAWSVS